MSLEAPEWPPLPAALRRELDGRSIHTRPGTAQYAAAAQLSLEDKLLTHAQAHGAPHLPADQAARRLGADPALLDAQLRDRASDPREHDAPSGLRLDQAAAVWHVLTSPRTVEIITGPAGTGKTRVLATAARIWDGPVFGTATSQNATNELRHAGIQIAANTTRLLADLAAGRIPPGSLIVADEGSMISMTHLAVLAEYAARNRCKLVLAGDQEQLAAVEGGGAMTLLASRLGYVQLAEPMRFAAGWERAASLRLRQGDATALDEYDQHGRIHGAPPDQAMDQAANAYVASYLTGRDVLLMAADWARCRELSARIRADLIHLGLVDATRSIRIADGTEASAGDLIICRRNDHATEAGEPGHTLANGDILRIEAVTSHGIMVRRLTDTNLAFVVTTPGRLADPQPGTRPAPGLRRYEHLRRGRAGHHPSLRTPSRPDRADARQPLAVLADILGRDGAALSATAVRERNLANADHLAALHAIWTAETTAARHDRYRELVMAALPPGHLRPLSHQARWLFRTLHAAELAGLDPAEVIGSAVAARDLAGARDIASVLDARIRTRVDPLTQQPQGSWAGRQPSLPDLARQAHLAEIAAMMDDRTRRLGQHASQTSPAWAVNALGPVPADPAARRAWEHKAPPSPRTGKCTAMTTPMIRTPDIEPAPG